VRPFFYHTFYSHIDAKAYYPNWRGYRYHSGRFFARPIMRMEIDNGLQDLHYKFKENQIDAAVAFIKAKDTGLYALVNNAGIGGGGPVLTTPVADQTSVYTVNMKGVYRVTKAFAPLVIESKGRTSTTGSVAGTITTSV